MMCVETRVVTAREKSRMFGSVQIVFPLASKCNSTNLTKELSRQVREHGYVNNLSIILLEKKYKHTAAVF